MPSSRRLKIRQLVNEKINDWIDNPPPDRKRLSQRDAYALFADISENALLALEEGRAEDVEHDLLFLIQTFRGNHSKWQAQDAINSARANLRLIHG